jgi:hypothetical protein
MGKGGLTSVLELRVSDSILIAIELMVERTPATVLYTAQIESYVT